VQTRAIPGARSEATLGSEREGTGIVITDSGMILTIGLPDRRGRRSEDRRRPWPHAAGPDRRLRPRDRPRAGQDGRAHRRAAGAARRVVERCRARSGDDRQSQGPDDVTLAYVVSRREFTGSWEYLLDQAIFTTPTVARLERRCADHREGKLLGVGSLIVAKRCPATNACPATCSSRSTR
jgi:hypothetical protein